MCLSCCSSERNFVDSHKKAVRSLSEQFGISIARVEAIIRLKEYQRQYEKVGYASY